MYSQPWSPTASTTVSTPELRTAKRSPAMPRTNTSPLVAPYSATLPTIMFCSDGNVALRRREHRELAARQSLAEVVVGVAFEREAHAVRHERAEALAGRALELDLDGVLGQTLRRPTSS